MSKYLVNETTLSDIACAIRSKCGKNDPIKVCEFADEIETIKTGSETVLIEQELTTNGEYTPENADGFSKVTVKVPLPSIIESPFPITENGTYTAEMIGADGISEITVDVPIPSGYIKPSGSITITKNSTVDVTDKEEVIVALTLPTGTKYVTKNGEADVYFYETVNVNVPTYITVATEEEAIDETTIPIVEGQLIIVEG